MCRNDSNEWVVESSKYIDLPKQPEIREGYSRYICYDFKTDGYFVAAGDNREAALWHYSKEAKAWKTVFEQSGILERPFLLSSNSTDKLLVGLTSWTESHGWQIIQIELDVQNSQVQSKKCLVESSESGAMEPWSALQLQHKDSLVVYDYKSGYLWEYGLTSFGIYAPKNITGRVGAGQSVGLACDNKFVFASCSDERAIRKFLP